MTSQRPDIANNTAFLLDMKLEWLYKTVHNSDLPQWEKFKLKQRIETARIGFTGTCSPEALTRAQELLEECEPMFQDKS